MSATPGIGCIGAGHWGSNLVRNFSELGALRAVCEADPGVRQAMATQYPDARVTADVNDILNDDGIAAVAIATPAESHGPLVRAALLAGKDVFVEKPLCLSAAEGDELVSLANRENRVLMVGHLLWYHPGILRLRELIESGELGRLQYIYSNRLNLGRIRREENILWSFAPHDISVMLGLVGEMPSAVEVRGGNYLHNEIADVTVSLFSFPSGVKGHVFVSWLHPYKEQKLVVVGDRQMAVFDDVEKHDKLVLYPHTIDWRNGLPVPSRADSRVVPVDAGEPLRAECSHFLECVATRSTPRTDGREALRVLRVLQECEASLRRAGGLAPVPPVTAGPAHRDNGAAPRAAGAAAGADGEGHAPKPDYFVHESSYVDDGCTIGKGTSIWHFCHVLTGTNIGTGCKIGQNVVMGPRVDIGNGVKIQNNVSVYEGVTLEDDVFCGPSMVFTNVFNPRSEIVRKDEYRKTLVKKGASIGANATIVCGVTIGRYAFIGAGAVVLRDVPDHALVVGNPARQVGWVCVCGNRVEFEGGGGEGTCPDCATVYANVVDGLARTVPVGP